MLLGMGGVSLLLVQRCLCHSMENHLEAVLGHLVLTRLWVAKMDWANLLRELRWCKGCLIVHSSCLEL